MPASKSNSVASAKEDRKKMTRFAEGEQHEDEKECCGIFMIKNILFVFNFFLLLSGLILICVGLWTVFNKHSYVSLLATAVYVATTYVLVLTGALIVAIVFGLGCLGAWKENKLCLTVYSILLILIFLLEAIGGTLAYFYEARIHDELVDNLNQTMIANYRRDVPITQSIDDMHIKFRCCGAGSFQDWVYTILTVPESCCKTPSKGCSIVSQHPSNINYQGCVDGLAKFLRPHLVVLGALGLGLCCLQVFGIIFSCWLIKKINDREQYPKSYWR